MASAIALSTLLTKYGFRHVVSALQAADVADADYASLSSSDVVSLGISGDDAAGALGLVADIIRYAEFDEVAQRLLQKKDLAAFSALTSALSPPMTPGGLAELTKLAEVRSEKALPAFAGAMVDALEVAAGVAERERWPGPALADARRVVADYRAARTAQIEAAQGRVSAAKEATRRSLTIAASGCGLTVILCAGTCGTYKAYDYVTSELDMREAKTLKLDQTEISAESLGTYSLPATGTMLNGKGAVVATGVPVTWSVGQFTRECTVSGNQVTVVTETSSCSLTFRPADFTGYADGTCNGHFSREGYSCDGGLQLPSGMVGDFKVNIDLSETRAARKIEADKGCFLTTAACVSANLPDDCHALTALRRFRDDVMLRRPDWAADVKHYYAIAPAIVEAIQTLDNPTLVWQAVFDRHILPAVSAVDQGRDAEAYARYRRLVRRLTVLVTRLGPNGSFADQSSTYQLAAML